MNRFIRVCRTALFLQAALLPVAAVSAEPEINTAAQPGDSDAPDAAQRECRFPGLELPRKAKIVAVGAYGGRPTGHQIDSSGYEATRFDLALHSPHEPLVLMLGAYAPSVWNIGMSRRTRVAAVLLSGFHTQKVQGISPDTPLLLSTHVEQGPCGFFYVDPRRRHTIDELSVRLFKREIDSLVLAEGGSASIGTVPKGEVLQSWSGSSVEDFYDTSAPRAGRLGLLDAITSGVLRKAKQRDVDTLLDLLERRYDWDSSQRKEYARRLATLDAYIIQKPFVFPAGLWGSNAAVFVVERGVPDPEGEGGHATVWFLDKGRACRGILCPQKQVNRSMR